ncbi:MAG: type II toxin-antitoxin system RelE/ParE family toxin [Desulfovibrio sp.]|jgi:mRNA interferase RelE/StbE|nr:type II toxin-antitoxin system RelE/ParE family toxin [Desulfovibrio sp.]
MGWTVRFEKAAERDLDRIDPQIVRRVLAFLTGRVAERDDPRSLGEALNGSELGEFWKYRVGDYRIVCRLEDAVVTVFVVRVGHRSRVYKQ